MTLLHRGVLIWTRLLLAVLVMCTVVMICMKLQFSPPVPYLVHWTQIQPITCHFDTTDDVLPSAENRRFSPLSRSIFFHETSCRGGLNSRQACAVEAAARAHPEWDVYVLFAGPVKTFAGCLNTLKVVKNVRFARIHIEDYARGTPLESLVTSGALNRSRWRVSHTSDVLRYLTLYKWGGVYLDLDTVVVKSFNTLKRNWAARESQRHVAAGAMSFSRDQLGRTIADFAIRDLAANFRGDKWGNNGPGVITRVLKDICSYREVSRMSSDVCHGFAVYAPELFYPIRWQDAQEYFEPGILKSPNVYLYHVWNRVTQDTKVLEDSRYANLAKRYCPSIYENHGEDFGVETKLFT